MADRAVNREAEGNVRSGKGFFYEDFPAHHGLG